MTSNNGSILADSLAFIPHLAAFDLMVKKRLSEFELDKLLVYLIDTVDADALPWLADQFDVLGFKGMRLATNEAEQREIIKKAIELHRFKGTLWAVREAITAIGFGDATITEHVAGHWAKFRIEIILGGRSISVKEIDELVKMVTEYKNARSHLEDISYSLEFTDEFILTDELIATPAVNQTDTIKAGGDTRHNGLILRNGSHNYSKDSDVLTIQIIPI